jgi:hypothetical protein
MPVFTSEELTFETDRTLFQATMRAAKKRDATVNKDRAYAVHGILQKLKVEVSDVKYEESEMKIYHSFCTDLLRRSGVSISLLLDAEGTETREVPSWIPDWRTRRERSWLQERIDISRRQESSGISPELAEAFHVECGRRFPSHQSLFPRFPSCPLESWVTVTNFWKPGAWHCPKSRLLLAHSRPWKSTASSRMLGLKDSPLMISTETCYQYAARYSWQLASW